VGSLIVSVLLAAAFGHIMRLAQERRCRMAWVGALNYLTACVPSIITWRMLVGTPLGPQEIIFGVMGGASWATAYLLMDVAIRLAGVSITQCVGWLGVTVPVALSALFFGETPNASQYAGLGMMVVAMLLLTPGTTSNVTRRSPWKVPALLGVFTCEGMINMAMKGFEVSVKSGGATAGEVDARISGLLIFMFATAAAGVLVAALARRERPRRREVIHGTALGLTAFLANFAFLRALNRFPAPIVFPGFWSGVILVTGVAAMLIWGERYTRRAWLGVFAALLTMILVSVDVFALFRSLL